MNRFAHASHPVIPLLAVVCAVSVGCGGSGGDETIPRNDPSIVGTITRVQRGTGSVVVAHVLLEEDPHAASGSAKASVRVTHETRIFVRSGRRLRRVTAAELTEGRQARAWFQGSVAESYPVQATARAIVLEPVRSGAATAPTSGR